MELKEGIILKTQIYQENSKILTIISESGLSTMLARGAASQKSHNYGYATEFTKIAFAVSEKGSHSFPIMTQGTIGNNFSRIKTDLPRLKDAMVIVDSVLQLGDHMDDSVTLYHFLDEILSRINAEYTPYYLVIFRLKLLYLLGVGPIFSKCVNCEATTELYGFDLINGGMICSNCQHSDVTFVNREVIEIIKFLYLTKMAFLTYEVISKVPDKIMEIDNFLDAYYQHFLGYSSRAEKIIKKLWLC